eukprot:7262054-Pyramimonas_sp.AAC.1
MSFLTSIQWRFFQYSEFPCKWAKVEHAGSTQEQKNQVFDDFYDLGDCCLDKHFSRKLEDLIPVKADLMQHKPFFC